MVKNGKCRICSTDGPLTFEHVPPKSAFNKASDLLTYGFDRLQMKWVQKSTMPYGIGEYTLCAKCNNDTGGIYGQAFCDFINVVAPITENQKEYRKPTVIRYKGFLHRILKQIVTMYCSANGAEFSKRNNLAEYLLNKDNKNFPSNFRVYIFLVNRRSKFQTGIQGILNLRTNNTIMVSEILFWPLGYILSLSELETGDLEGLHVTEITDWKNCEIDKRDEVEITLFKNYRLLMFPLDYRSKEEIEATSGAPIPPPGQFPAVDYEI